MLDEDLKAQLRQHFAALTKDVALILYRGAHDKHAELRELLADVASCGDKISFVESPESVPTVRFEVHTGGKPSGISFRGVPGGHEFTSLIIAILNAGGLGKMPDDGIKRRVRALKGPVRVRTFISLSCTNCPDVVQALNQMAIIHPDFRHEMVDGELAEDEIASLGIQGVPAVELGGAIVHVGRSTFGELLENLEGRLGHAPATDEPPKEPVLYDVVVIGGGPAGASAAIYSARKGLKTAVVAQRIGGQVQETVGIENLISVTYTEGQRLAADLEKHLRSYPIDVYENRKVDRIVDAGARKELHIVGGEIFKATSLILATGAKWRELGVPGEKDYLGKGVAFCPHCDGPFYKGRKVAVVGGGNSGVEAGIDLAGICSHVTVVEYGNQLKADDVLVKNLRALPNVTVLTHARTTEVVGNGQGVTALRYQDRTTDKIEEIPVDGVFVQIGLVPNSAVAKDVVDINKRGEIVVDDRCRTNVPGIYAAGDVSTVPFKQIIIAMGEGAKAALTAFEDRIRAA